MNKSWPVLEICVDSVASAVAAQVGSANRVELCCGLDMGGLTPSLGLLRSVRSRISIGLHILVRPRAGSFFYSDEEFEVMQQDIATAKEHGANGVVLGLLTLAGEVDVHRTAMLIAQARPMEVTYHRAIDVAHEPLRAFQQVMETGADRVLTSGGQMSALEGSPLIREFIDAAQGRMKVMVGGGVRAESAGQIARQTGAVEWHASLRANLGPSRTGEPGAGNVADQFGGSSAQAAVSSQEVRRLRRAILTACVGPPTGDADLDPPPPGSLR